MKIYKYILSSAFLLSLALVSCTNTSEEKKHGHDEEKEESHEENVVTISKQQNKVLNLEFKGLRKRNLNNFVKASGKIEIQAKNKASISFPIGANISAVYVVQGQKVSKGQILAKLNHPDIIEMQTQYQQALSNLEFLKQDFERQELLLKNNITSGKQYQKVKADYMSVKARVAGFENKLSLLNIPSKLVAEGKIIKDISLRSSINGTISKVNINLGKFIEPQQELFEILDTKEKHVDIKVFEADIKDIKVGNEVIFTINNSDKDEYKAEVTSIASSVDEHNRAITVHAVIINNNNTLIPGMYVSARILTSTKEIYAISESAVVIKDNKSYVFIIDNDQHEDKDEHGHDDKEGSIKLKMIEVKTGIKDMGYIEIAFYENQKSDIQIAQNGAYYLLAEMNKSETEHVH